MWMEQEIWDWRDEFVVKNSSCSSGGHEFESQHPCGDLQLPLTPDSRDLKTSSGLHGHWANMWCTDINAGKTWR